MAVCVCGAPVVYKRDESGEQLPMDAHEAAGRGPNRYVEVEGRVRPATERFEGLAWTLHDCPRRP